tara:strand:+ start:417 stop:614 length:198 start_codon:yes stop_codon:yes gene_type:complete
MSKKTNIWHVTVKQEVFYHRKLEVPKDVEFDKVVDLAEVNFKKENWEWEKETSRTYECIDGFKDG